MSFTHNSKYIIPKYIGDLRSCMVDCKKSEQLKFLRYSRYFSSFSFHSLLNLLIPSQGSEELPILYIHRQSSYLLGRDRKVADIPLDHPRYKYCLCSMQFNGFFLSSCSKQHAVLQYRLVPFTR